MRAVSRFVINVNGFKGALPEEGMGTMTTMATLAIQHNGFTGVLPESGLQVMRTMLVSYVYDNRFTGTLPNRVVAGIEALSAQENKFEGKISQTQCARTFESSTIRVM
eukprot:2398245-Amphidinium_carterae.1